MRRAYWLWRNIKFSATRAVLTAVFARSSTAQTAEGEAAPPAMSPRAISSLEYARRLESYGRSVPLTTTSIVGRHARGEAPCATEFSQSCPCWSIRPQCGSENPMNF
jgi:hypothetical protein